ncbi:MAG: hypothetical protein FWC27_07275 [Firmicutes bacterium]|nr:hypothetical protein [Bacillota bacterium]
MRKNKLREIAHAFLNAPFPGAAAIVSALLSLYLACVFAFHGFFASWQAKLWMIFPAVVLLAPLFYYLQKQFAEKCPGFGPSGLRRERDRLSWQIFAVVAGVTFAALLFNLAAHYPGAASWDNMEQWDQVQTGEFRDWHPAIHTMLIWLVTRIVNKYVFFIAVQMLCFSLLAGWGAATLRAWGLKRAWIIAFTVSLLSARATGNILLFAWKDTMFTLLILGLAVQMADIVLSDAAWLRKWPNRAAFALTIALASLVRHNGIFFTIPVLVLLLILYRKKSFTDCLLSALMACVAFLGVRGPLYSLARVTRDPNQGYVEAVGLPMTILCSVYRTEPEKLDSETHTLMAAIATPEEWETYFAFGNYNSIKWIVGANETLRDVPLKSLLGMTLRCLRAAPETSLRAALSLTQFVWDPNVWDYTIDFMRSWDHPENHPNSISEQAANADAEKVGAIEKRYGVYREAVQLLTPSKLLQSAGIHMLALALAGAYSLRRRRGIHTLLLIVPSAAYNIGTMLMLCGGDYRFFQFNAVITIPLVLVCLAREEETSIARDTSLREAFLSPPEADSSSHGEEPGGLGESGALEENSLHEKK